MRVTTVPHVQRPHPAPSAAIHPTAMVRLGETDDTTYETSSLVPLCDFNRTLFIESVYEILEYIGPIQLLPCTVETTCPIHQTVVQHV